MRSTLLSKLHRLDPRDDHRRFSMTLRRITCCLALCITIGAGVVDSQQSTGGLFPDPFVIEHAVTVTEPDGGSFTGEPVVDHYGGSMIVSARPDGSRLIVDFARRELTEIRPSSATYTVITFDRFAQLTREYQSLEGAPVVKRDEGDAPELTFRVSDGSPSGQVKMASAQTLSASAGILDRPGLRRVEVTAENDGELAEQPALEAWVDTSHRFSPRAMDAVEDFELEILGAASDEQGRAPLKALATARRHSDGAVPVITARPTLQGGGLIEDVATRIEPLDAFPTDLVKIPEGFRRTAHPLELMVAHAEREAELRTLMSGNGGGR